MADKLMSLIVTAHNEEKYLARCLNSLIDALKGKENLYEIIISNNNSTDRTLEIATDFCNKYENIQVINSTKKGPSVARNVGLSVAKGDFITFIDGDDYVDGNLLKTFEMVEKNQQVDVFQFSYYIHKSDKTILPNPCEDGCYEKVFNNSEFFEKLSLNTAFSSSSSKIIKMELIKKNNLSYNEEFFQMEDMDFGVRVWSLAKSFMFLSNAYYHYETRHEGSLTTKISLDRMLLGVKAAKSSMDYLLENNSHKKGLQFVSLMSFSLIRRNKDLDKEERKTFLTDLKKNKIILNYPAHTSTKLFYLFSRVFGLGLALKFI